MYDLKGNVVQDTKTGENVVRHKVPEEMDAPLIKTFNEHGAINTELAGRLEQVLLHIKTGLELLDKKTSKERFIKEQMKNVCRKLQLNEVEPWGYNFQEHAMEKRCPPVLAQTPVPQGDLPSPQGDTPNG